MAHRMLAGDSTRRSRRWLLLLLGALLAIGLLAGLAVAAVRPDGEGAQDGDGSGAPQAPEETAQEEGPAFGVLGSSCDPGRMSALADAGVRFAEVELAWENFEPERGVYDEDYRDFVRRMVDQCDAAGIGVVLTLGLHSAPPWVADLPAGAYRNQDGAAGPDDVPNLVFSSAVRSAVADYLAALDDAVPLDRFAAIRVGTGDNGELGYPSGGPDSDDGNPYWAFDEAAQEGEGLAGGMSITPLPGWVPGATTWRGEDLDEDDVREWFAWYSRSVAEAEVWVVQTLREQGYTGDIHLPLAGRGALPPDLDDAVAAYLDGTGNRDGSLESGLFYPLQLNHIAERLDEQRQPEWGEVYADSASVDDATAVAARALEPPQDSCRPDDAERDLLDEPQVVQWPSFRWTVAVARQAGLPVMGENPGSPDTPSTGASETTDSAAEQMRQAPRYARECDLALLMWAFEDYLFSPTSDVDVETYARRISGEEG